MKRVTNFWLVGRGSKEKETRTKKLVGKEATELSTEKYGPGEWRWLLLEPSPPVGGC